jgi:hypothetical protein
MLSVRFLRLSFCTEENGELRNGAWVNRLVGLTAMNINIFRSPRKLDCLEARPCH